MLSNCCANCLLRHDDLLAYDLLVGVLLVVGLRAEGDDDLLAPLVPVNHEEAAVLDLDDVADAVEVALRTAGRGPPRLELLAQGLDLGYFLLVGAHFRCGLRLRGASGSEGMQWAC